jgi:hypothetical protein
MSHRASELGNRKYVQQLGRPRRRWEDNIRMDLRAIGWKGVDWMHLVQDRDQRQSVMKTVMNLRVPLKAGYFLID